MTNKWICTLGLGLRLAGKRHKATAVAFNAVSNLHHDNHQHHSFTLLTIMQYTFDVDGHLHKNNSSDRRSFYKRAFDKLRTVFFSLHKTQVMLEDFDYCADSLSDCSINSLNEILETSIVTFEWNMQEYQDDCFSEDVCFSKGEIIMGHNSPHKCSAAVSNGNTNESIGTLVQDIAVLDKVATLVDERDNTEQLAGASCTDGRNDCCVEH